MSISRQVKYCHTHFNKNQENLWLCIIYLIKESCVMVYKIGAYQYTIPPFLQYPHLSIGPKAFLNENNGN